MKKIFSIIGLFLFAINLNAQITYSKDTVLVQTFRGNNNVTPTIDIVNNGNLNVDCSWTIDSFHCIIPTGYTLTGVCMTPGSCYPFNSITHINPINANSTALMDATATVGANARFDSSLVCIVNTTINGNPKKLVFMVQAMNWPASINTTTKPAKISLEMYPIPATERLNIVHNSPKVTKAYVFNMLGKRINEFYTPVGANGFSIPVADMPNGLYIIDVRDANNNSLATQRFSKN